MLSILSRVTEVSLKAFYVHNFLRVIRWLCFNTDHHSHQKIALIHIKTMYKHKGYLRDAPRTLLYMGILRRQFERVLFALYDNLLCPADGEISV